MSQPDTDQRRAAAAPNAVQASGVTRIDPSHTPSARGEALPAEGPEMPKEPALADVAEGRLRTQAEQLASQLRTRQKDIDHRESQVNAEMAQLDRDSRTARLWLTERQAELDQSREEIVRQEREVQARLERLAVAESAQCSQAAASAEIGRREAELAEAAKQLAGQVAREDVLRRTAEGLAARQRQLDEAEARLAEAHAETQQLREQLLADRLEVQEQGCLEQEKTAAEHRRAMDDLEKKRQAVQRRAEHVDQCRLALQQLRADLGRMHRETLEIRLATEELWVQLSGAAPPAALTRSLGRIRSKLADHYRRANAEVQAQRAELEGIRSQLSEQHQKLVQQKRHLEQWSIERHQEVEQQAARLVAREEQLRQQETELKDSAHRWQAERLEYQHEIRRLQARVPRPTETAIPA